MIAPASQGRVGAISLRRFVNDYAGVKMTPAEFQAAPAGSIVAHS